MKLIYSSLIMLVIVLLAGCGAAKSVSRDNSVEYRDAKEFPTLKVPATNSAPAESDSKK